MPFKKLTIFCLLRVAVLGYSSEFIALWCNGFGAVKVPRKSCTSAWHMDSFSVFFSACFGLFWPRVISNHTLLTACGCTTQLLGFARHARPESTRCKQPGTVYLGQASFILIISKRVVMRLPLFADYPSYHHSGQL